MGTFEWSLFICDFDTNLHCTLDFSSSSNTGFLGRGGGEGISVLSAGITGSNMTIPESREGVRQGTQLLPGAVQANTHLPLTLPHCSSEQYIQIPELTSTWMFSQTQTWAKTLPLKGRNHVQPHSAFSLSTHSAARDSYDCLCVLIGQDGFQNFHGIYFSCEATAFFLLCLHKKSVSAELKEQLQSHLVKRTQKATWKLLFHFKLDLFKSSNYYFHQKKKELKKGPSNQNKSICKVFH